MSHLKYADAKYVFLTDFDGTITLLVSWPLPYPSLASRSGPKY